MNGLARLLAPGVLAAHPALSIFVGARLSIASMGGVSEGGSDGGVHG